MLDSRSKKLWDSSQTTVRWRKKSVETAEIVEDIETIEVGFADWDQKVASSRKSGGE